ncbi:iduronate 2-sulfatase-like [Dreissena polymorpha]|uniref:Sulfatase N-terminal domain-containing protein n=1 Tax=Dreissena polymorpha TaxID=45954 RepID=A0A9D4DZA5_DREPO|nr:iduronate 2-sulfatase-like [Dreissena polymorpha]KAH3769616.1 hypothetical protein DPMN_170889 [Dreissena polymorpha]
MRADLGCYQGADFPSRDDPQIHSPNIDALARKSLLLKKAYVQQAICSPSRTSFLTSRRPDTTHVYDLQTYFRTATANFTTIPQYFKNHGRITAGMGKIFHPVHDSHEDYPFSWTEPYVQPRPSSYEASKISYMYVNDSQLADDPLMDYKIAQAAVSALQNFATGGKYADRPFFLAVGFARPHLPFVSPEAFTKFYPDISIILPRNPYAPTNMPDPAWWKSLELITGYTDIAALNFHGLVNETLPPSIARELRRAYFSAISWVDSLVGVVLNELERLGLSNDTVVSLLGDHGYHLGEHGIWTKHTNFEVATHAPMMVRIPGLTDNGIITDRLVEFVDLFPTLVDAVGLPPVPVCPENSQNVLSCTEGVSFMPLFHNATMTWKPSVFSQYPRAMQHVPIMGYSLRSDRYRYTEWVAFSYRTHKPDWTRNYGTELYDHQTDPDENYNMASDQAFADLARSLSTRLHAGWRQASPSTQASPSINNPSIIG